MTTELKKAHIKSHFSFLFFLFLTIFIATLLSRIGPGEIVTYLGVENTYLLIFLFSMVGGVSFVSATSFYAAIVTFVLGGVDPFWAAVVAAPGILIGDLLFWYVGVRGRSFAGRTFGNRLFNIISWLRSRPRKVVLSVIYLYTGFTPLPGDVLMIVLALSGYKFKDIWLPTLLGNMTLVFLLGHAALFGPSIFTVFLR